VSVPTSTLTAALLGGAPAFPEGLPLMRLVLSERQRLRSRLDEILDSGQLTNGRTVAELEERAAELLDVPHIVAVSSCTTGLMLVLQALGATETVLMPSFTFSATAHAAAWVGATPAFADVDPERLTLDPSDAAARLGDATVLMGTHVYGTPCAVEPLQELADRAGIPLVYDAAHALGSRRRGRPIGGFGTAEVFSMSPTKVAVAGEGGLISTRDGALAETLRLARNYGNPGDYDCLFAGLNARMSELHAAVALSSLASLDQRVAHRNALVQAFRERIDGLPGVRIVAPDAADLSTYKDLTLVVDPPAFGLHVPQFAEALRADGVDSRRYFYPAVHRQRAYAHLPVLHLPVTDVLAEQVLTLPLWSHMEENTVRRLGDLVARLHQQAPALRLVLQ
jgi:dTDP-4-amino-4,6-dideoxygalactose transaminase